MGASSYFNHWIEMGQQHDIQRLPAIFYVNWFRKSADGDLLWPGFGQNSRVLKWVIERLEGTAGAVETPIGQVPAPGSIDVDGLPVTEQQLAEAVAVDNREWLAETTLIEEWFAKIGDRMPAALLTELDALKARLEN